jgi:predicted aspartyl protease
VASASADKTVKLWQLPTGKELATLAGHTGAVRAVAFDLTGKKLTTAGADKTVRLWDTATGEVLAVLKGHAGEVTSVAFGPDGKFVFTASADKTVKVWDVHSARVADQKAHPDLESAQGLFKAGKFAEAGKLYARIATTDPRHYATLVRLGSIALLSNRLDEAQRWLEKASDLKPKEADAKVLLAEVFYRRDEFQKAAPLLRAAGREAKTKKLESFKGLRPYEIQGREESTSLKFVVTDPLPLVRVRVNGGKEVNFLVDTGGSEVTLDTEFARQLGIKPLATERGTFAGGKTAAVHHGRIDSLGLGTWTVRNVPVMLLGSRRLSGPLFGGKHRVDGVIGTVLLYHFVSTLDYPGGQLILRRRGQESLKRIEEVQRGGATVVPFWMAGDHTVVAWGRIEERDPVLLFVDTGLAGGGVSLSESALKEAGIKLLEEQATKVIGGGGWVKSIPFKLRRLSLGGATERDVRGWFDGVFPMEHTHGFRIAGIVSHSFFKPYALTLDFTGMRLFLKRKS